MNIKTFIKITSNFSGSFFFRQPRLIQCALYLSFRCNLRCQYCNLPNLNVNELMLHEWYQIIDQLAILNCCRITILGGEPLIYPHLADIIRRIRSKGMACIVVSNGLLVPDNINAIAEANTLVLSVDAAGPEHDHIRGSGVWNKVKEALRVSLKRGLDIKINATLTSETLPSLKNLLDFARENRIGITLNLIRTGNRSLWKNASAFRPDSVDIRRAFNLIAEYSRQNRFLLFPSSTYKIAGTWPDYSIDCVEEQDIESFIGTWKGPRCQAGRYYMSILPDGSVVPCPIRIGPGDTINVMDNGVEKAWKALHNHSCAACYSPCLLTLNSLFSFDASALLHFLTRHVPRVT